MTETPDTHQRWTVTLPDDSAFDLVIENDYDAERRLDWLLELAGVDAYGTHFTPDKAPEPAPEPEPECHCREYAGPCYVCVDRAEALVGRTVRDSMGREGVVTDHGDKNCLATVSFGEHYWAYLDDVEVYALHRDGGGEFSEAAERMDR